MTDDSDLETRLRRHLAAEADELPFLLDPEMVRPRLRKRRRRWLPLAFVPAAAALILAVTVGPALLTDPGQPDPGRGGDWGPLAVVPSTGGDQALSTGVLRITDRCVVLETAGGDSELLVWPADRTRWEAADASIFFSDLAGREVKVADGVEVVFSGGGDATAESGVSGDAWVASTDWVAAPDTSCPKETRWYVGEIVSAAPLRLGLPPGTFVSDRPFDGVCLALTIRTPTAATHASQWWNAGASGDCRTRTSDISTTLADFSDAPAMTVSIPLMDGGTQDIRLRFTGMFDDEIRFARSGEFEVSFKRSDEVAPTFAPLP